MKRPIIITIAVVIVLFVFALIINPLTIQSASKGDLPGKPIPADVKKIAEKSCFKCHIEPGDFMAVSHLNLSNWDKYSLEKQAAKASKMCTMVTKDKMPPKGFRSKHPDGVPSTEELKTICDWAASLQAATK